MANKLSEAHHFIQEKFPVLKKLYEDQCPGYSLTITEAYRSPERQQKLYQQGRTLPGPKVTNVDGVKVKGAHNYDPARAVDVAVVLVGSTKALWVDKYYYPLTALCQAVGLESGGSWASFKDYPHVQLPGYKDKRWDRV